MTARISAKEAREIGLPVPKRKHKYGAVATTVDGVKFQSKHEAERYGELKILENTGQIYGLELQPKFDLHASGGMLVGTYKADFSYWKKEYISLGPDSHWESVQVFEDAKGVRTEAYKWKKKHTELEYGIKIIET